MPWAEEVARKTLILNVFKIGPSKHQEGTTWETCSEMAR